MNTIKVIGMMIYYKIRNVLAGSPRSAYWEMLHDKEYRAWVKKLRRAEKELKKWTPELTILMMSDEDFHLLKHEVDTTTATIVLWTKAREEALSFIGVIECFYLGMTLEEYIDECEAHEKGWINHNSHCIQHSCHSRNNTRKDG